MALFRSERGIGRGEMAESQLEVPFFAVFILVAGVSLLAQHLYYANFPVTVALAVSMVFFGATVMRVEVGVYLLIIAMLLSPEIGVGNTLSGENELNLRYDDVLIIVVFFGVMVKLAFEGRFSLWQPSPINLGIFCYYSVCLFSSALAYERALGAWDKRTALFVLLKMMEFYLIFILVGQSIRSHKDLRTALFFFFAVSLIVNTYAIYTIGATPRVGAPFERDGTEPNTLGGYLVICMCVALGLFTQAKTMRHRMLFLALIAFSFVPFLYTLSRASYVALLVGVTVISVASRQIWIIAVCVLAVVVLTFVIPVMPVSVVERVQFTFQDEGVEVSAFGQETGIRVDKSTHERVQIWSKVEFILFRVGIEFFLFGGGVSWESVLDSQYARVILETGMVGLAAFIFLQLTLVYTIRQAYRWTEDWVARGVALGMFATTIALMVHSFGTISFLIVRIMEPFWFLAALCAMIRNEALARYFLRLQAQRLQVARAKAAGEETPQDSGVPAPAQPAVASRGTARA
ncbi:MAG: hypothetical protein HYV27_21195 [Candidatus Hydrogenedentes bacterium]|nr:hypothetical protein [Candidatus Hydrogenedentota bacterium]